MRTDSKSENQHYVPRMLLRRHAINADAAKKAHRVWCFDKRSDRVFSSNISGVLSETSLYDVDLGNVIGSLEPALTEIESRAAPVIDRIITRRSVADLSNRERRIIATFVAIQFARTQAARDYVESINRQLVEALAAKGITKEHLSDMRILSDSEIKELWLKELTAAPETYAPHFSAKHWHLATATQDNPFYLGDNPVALENPVNKSPYGGLGIASPGICIYLPLSPTLCLSMMDAQVVAQLRAMRAQAVRSHKLWAKRLQRQIRFNRAADGAPAAIDDMAQRKRELDTEMLPLLQGGASPASPDVITRINSLQVMYANRWVTYSMDHFQLARQMISDDECFRGNTRQLKMTM